MNEIPKPSQRDHYIIQNNGQYFNAGQTPNNDQVLFGILSGEKVLELSSVWFDPAGRINRFNTVEVITNPDETVESAQLRQLVNFQKAINYHPSAIRVEKFSIENRFIKIEDIPEHDQVFLNNPHDYDSERSNQLADDVRK